MASTRKGIWLELISALVMTSLSIVLVDKFKQGDGWGLSFKAKAAETRRLTPFDLKLAGTVPKPGIGQPQGFLGIDADFCEIG